MIPMRITKRYAMGLMAVAAFFDLLSLIPGFNVVTAIVGQLLLAGLFRLKGVNVFRYKQAVTYAIATLVEIYPGSSFLPFFLVETLALISLSWARRA
ncbi:MAG: hypothetical protein HZA81_01565 [Candidatus Taylorbacteria bacterium]|nr:hypothetical protein [Candidatus Taylorbacteria bacterium]